MSSLNYTTSDISRFWAKVQKTEACWIWQAARQRKGYGRFGIKKLTVSAHRFSWILVRGEIPLGLCICHHCDNPPCVNPDHLFLGTNADNTRDSINKGRLSLNAVHGEAHPNNKLLASTVLAIRREVVVGISMRELARRYNVSHVTIQRIVHREIWIHL